jgi:hypothetical protein
MYVVDHIHGVPHHSEGRPHAIEELVQVPIELVDIIRSPINYRGELGEGSG